ncbi:LSU ribosomal protein L29P [Desulfocapsa sulfexigens DSM 10523]|uniref:Large ribosomal subunit protein uL29 n=1 Tax=Desulfocapsa sulfexigens (strain DSM 10523 / SB164P1) TaxID=1167006 RepID=M1NG13_DESSD|nr:50S ribosomal protein L29 [Desulfocapsa sulfexigens]AGF78599.1 LSU ribosomal protein L29P [Desulfocapsa sulfexigens DSM 10523]
MKMSELRSMSEDDLQKKLVEMKEEISNLSFQHKIRPLENTSVLKQLRKDIARINTLFNEN